VTEFPLRAKKRDYPSYLARDNANGSRFHATLTLSRKIIPHCVSPALFANINRWPGSRVIFAWHVTA